MNNELFCNEKKCYVCGRFESDFKPSFEKEIDRYESEIIQINEKIRTEIDKIKEIIKPIRKSPFINFSIKTLVTDIDTFEKKSPGIQKVVSFCQNPEETLSAFIARTDSNIKNRNFVELSKDFKQVSNYAVTIKELKENQRSLLNSILKLHKTTVALKKDQKSFEYSIFICDICNSLFEKASNAAYDYNQDDDDDDD